MKTISEHTFDETIIDKNGFILDLGCINFSFSLEMKKYCNNIICVDPNKNINNPPDGVLYENAAVVSGDEKESDFYIYNDINGYSLLNPSKDWCSLIEIVKVKSFNIKDLMKKYSIEQFELIKFDIEGAEYQILENIDWTISKQYSVEFHDFRNMNPHTPNNQIFYDELFKKMNNYCDIIKHEITDHQGFPNGLGKNYWDSLFILKKEFWKTNY